MNKVLLSLATLSIAFSSLLSNKVDAADPTQYLENRTIYAKAPINYEWYDYKRGLFEAEQRKKYVLLNFCVRDDKYCGKLGKSYEDETVKTILREKFVTINIDGASNFRVESQKNMPEKALLKKYEIDAYPTIAFLDPKGKQVSGLVKGYLTPEKLAVILKYISSESYKKTTLSSFEKKLKK